MKISKASLCNIMLSNGSYRLKPEIAKTNAKVLVIAGEKESKAVKGSARDICRLIINSRLYLAPGMKHGEWSMVHDERYGKLLREFMKREECQ